MKDERESLRSFREKYIYLHVHIHTLYTLNILYNSYTTDIHIDIRAYTREHTYTWHANGYSWI